MLREREEIANDRRRFELLRERVYLGLELLVLAIALLLAIVLYLQGKEAATLIFLGGGAGFGGIAALLHHRSDAAPE